MLLLLTLFVILSFPAFSQQPVQSLNLSKSGLAIDGYDPVSYFTLGTATEGRKDLSYDLHGAMYRFATAQNRQLFIANPARYLPQYGGWCAYAMGETGEKVEIDPETYKIRNGKLYLFYHTWAVNTLPKWNKNEINLNIKADANWLKFNH